jgi:hypothetical protein
MMVGVAVGNSSMTTVGVEVEVAVLVAVGVGVAVSVSADMSVGVEVGVAVEVGVSVSVGVGSASSPQLGPGTLALAKLPRAPAFRVTVMEDRLYTISVVKVYSAFCDTIGSIFHPLAPVVGSLPRLALSPV